MPQCPEFLTDQFEPIYIKTERFNVNENLLHLDADRGNCNLYCQRNIDPLNFDASEIHQKLSVHIIVRQMQVFEFIQVFQVFE